MLPSELSGVDPEANFERSESCPSREPTQETRADLFDVVARYPSARGSAMVGASSVCGSPEIRLARSTRGERMSKGRARCMRQRLSQTTTSPSVHECLYTRGGWQASSISLSSKAFES